MQIIQGRSVESSAPWISSCLKGQSPRAICARAWETNDQSNCRLALYVGSGSDGLGTKLTGSNPLPNETKTVKERPKNEIRKISEGHLCQRTLQGDGPSMKRS